MISHTSLVLVCFLPKPRDLEIARVLGWYRIPLRSAPKVQYVAAVRGHELTTRAELLRDEPEHPHANEEYFKIQLGALERLKNPIKADKWKRITFFYTTGEYLLRASSLNDLVVNSDERQLLWQSLRERAEHDQLYKTDLPEVNLSPEVLIALLGIKDSQAEYQAG
jgi:hypothetical protein